MYVRRGGPRKKYVCKEGGVLCDIAILKIEAKTVNMYVRKGGPTHYYKICKGVREKNMYVRRGGVEKISCHPPVLFFGIALI